MIGLLFLAASAVNGHAAWRTSRTGRFDPKGLDATRARHSALFRAGAGMYWLLCGIAAAAGIATLLGFGQAH
jgi:hypothetical protein